MTSSLSGSGDGSQSVGEDVDDRGTKRIRFRDDVTFRDKLQRLLASWKNTVMVKLLGHPLGYRLLYSQIDTLWKPQGRLPIQYYNPTILRAIGAKLGRVIKVDKCTLMVNCGKYAHVAIELDIAKLLYAFYTIEGV
ncbi:hypothetical protein GH714_014038 [Hevea brasiliensis]|uniref:DUF4283 domain-containing protein n=1 Tax=Hevea brasiliensis TaxID=3981 RepID=A0A6A6K621_HEVBR|nr:hypothetical protein GH714_014038 [Hevea brasiliensis]